MAIDWNEFVQTVAPRLYRFFRARYAADGADDLVQEVLIRLVGKVNSGAYDPKHGTLAAYSFGIAHFVAREAFTSRRRTREDLDIDEPRAENFADERVEIERDFESAQQADVLRRAIAKMSESEQEILALLVDRDLTLFEIAQILGMPLNTVKSHMRRAKPKLRQELEFLRQDPIRGGLPR